MSEILDLDVLGLLLSYLFALILLMIVRYRGMKKEREIILSTLRMTVQLVAMGYFLIFVFQNPNPLITLAIFAAMITAASVIIIRRSKGLSRQLKWSVAISVAGGCIITLLFFIFLVIRVNPWYDPRYFIPISGMIVGNAMNGAALGLKTMRTGFKDRRGEVENSLMLGATPAVAMRPIVNSAFDSAITPTVNSMLGMGIVSLPGMMTGQILSGTLPVTAIKYQIGIMLAIMGSVSLSAILLLTLGYRTFFSKDGMILENPPKEK